MTGQVSARHRAEVRPRYGRIATLGSSVAVVVVAVLGGAGVLPSSADDPPRNDAVVAPRSGADTDSAAGAAADTAAENTEDAAEGRAATRLSQEPVAEQSSPDAADEEAPAKTDDGLVPVSPADATRLQSALPADSGSGKRVVFSESRQRVWLVTEDEKVLRTYLVSGSVYDNLEPGTYEVYSRAEDAVGIDDSGSMKYFVRFTQGDTGAAIGFHDIPVDDGRPVQTLDQLGTPLSHGCVRQRRQDAVALWEFAPLGTTVVVTA